MRRRSLAAFCLCAALPVMAAPAQAQTCDLAFSVEITQGVGPIAPGTQLDGGAVYTLDGRSFPQDGGATGHMASGHMQLEGGIDGEVWTVITRAGSVATDMVGLFARDVEGLSFAGVDFDGPMILMLFAPSGTRDTVTPPRTQAGWDALDLRRSFTLHASGADMLSGLVRDLTVTCE